MTQAKRDNNQVPTMLAVLNTDGATPTPLKADPTRHSIDVSDGSTGSDLGADLASRDDNQVTGIMATDASGNLIPLYADSSGHLLINMN